MTVVRDDLMHVTERSVAEVDHVDATQIRRAVIVAGFVRRELVRFGSGWTRLIRGVAVGTDDERFLVLVVQTVDRTHA